MFLYTVHLAVAAVTGKHQHLRAGSTDLGHFPAAVMYAFFIVTAGQCPAAAAAAHLMHPAGMQVNPIGHTLVQYPPRFFKKAMAKALPGAATVIAWIMVRRSLSIPLAIQFDPPGLDIFNEQIEHGDGFELFQGFGIPCLQTIPGCQIGMASFGPQKGFNVKPAHVVDNSTGHGLHGLIISGEIAPGRPLPVF